MFNEINLFDNKNRDLLKCFLFFFVVAICSYLSLMVSFCPFSDDVCRYLVNSHVGTFASNRIFTFLIETFAYLSNVITDAAPFSYVLACAFLAYGAVVCLKIFKVNLNSKLEVACFVPVVATPYMFEIMMFRFDNPFSTLALLFCIVAAYISTQNSRKLLFTQTGIFFLSLFIYQPASSAYFILGMYKFLEEIRAGRYFTQTISKMRYWIYTVLISVVAYIPFTYLFNYRVTEDGSMLALPFNTKNIDIILGNIGTYYSNLYTDWSQNTAGILFFFIFFISVLYSAIKIKKFSSICVYLTGVFVLTLCPLGASTVLKNLICNETIPPRSLYSIGILISGALYGTSLLFRVSEKAYGFYSFVITSLCFWNMIFLNSAANVIHCYHILQWHVLYDVSKDIHEIREKNKNLSGFCCTGNLQTYAMNNFVKLYPIINRIIPEQWYIPTMCQIALIDYKFAESFIKYFPVDKIFDQNKYNRKRLAKSSSLYDIFIWDEKGIEVNFKSSHKNLIKDLNYAQIGNED
ncbi:MAG: glucosyltransferase domain-containing protein [Alphaproteobacteria bacterium]|nr:glucosyltransferase domain-containing protein [Alphaproteobacteria bacterium]